MKDLKEKNIQIKEYAIMASGVGSNALALCQQGINLNRPPRFVVVNKEESSLPSKLKSIDIECHVIPSTKKGIDEEFEKKVLKICDSLGVNFLFLAGFMKILSTSFLNFFNQEGVNQVVNIHPSILPKYPGIGGYKKAFENEDEVFGHTIHIVTNELDSGPILMQKVLNRPKNSNFEELIEFGKSEENISYQWALKRLLISGLIVNENNVSLGEL